MQTEYEIRLASEETGEVQMDIQENYVYRLIKGDYHSILSHVIVHLCEAREYASNDTERHMIEAYVRHFTTGSLSEHKQGSRLWIKDKAPPVESYIGFIETYRDPAGNIFETRVKY